MDFLSMKRKQLQALCKKNGIPANLTNLELAERLTVFFKEKEKLDDVQGEIESAEVEKKVVKKVRFSPHDEVFEFRNSSTRVAGRRLGRKRNLSLLESDDNVAKNDALGKNVVKRLRRKSTASSSKGLKPVIDEKLDVGAEEETGRIKGRIVRRSKRNAALASEDEDSIAENLDSGEDGRMITRFRRKFSVKGVSSGSESKKAVKNVVASDEQDVVACVKEPELMIGRKASKRKSVVTEGQVEGNTEPLARDVIRTKSRRSVLEEGPAEPVPSGNLLKPSKKDMLPDAGLRRSQRRVSSIYASAVIGLASVEMESSQVDGSTEPLARDVIRTKSMRSVLEEGPAEPVPSGNLLKPSKKDMLPDAGLRRSQRRVSSIYASAVIGLAGVEMESSQATGTRPRLKVKLPPKQACDTVQNVGRSGRNVPRDDSEKKDMGVLTSNANDSDKNMARTRRKQVVSVEQISKIEQEPPIKSLSRRSARISSKHDTNVNTGTSSQELPLLEVKADRNSGRTMISKKRTISLKRQNKLESEEGSLMASRDDEEIAKDKKLKKRCRSKKRDSCIEVCTVTSEVDDERDALMVNQESSTLESPMKLLDAPNDVVTQASHEIKNIASAKEKEKVVQIDAYVQDEEDCKSGHNGTEHGLLCGARPEALILVERVLSPQEMLSPFKSFSPSKPVVKCSDLPEQENAFSPEDEAIHKTTTEGETFSSNIKSGSDALHLGSQISSENSEVLVEKDRLCLGKGKENEIETYAHAQKNLESTMLRKLVSPERGLSPDEIVSPYLSPSEISVTVDINVDKLILWEKLESAELSASELRLASYDAEHYQRRCGDEKLCSNSAHGFCSPSELQGKEQCLETEPCFEGEQGLVEKDEIFNGTMPEGETLPSDIGPESISRWVLREPSGQKENSEEMTSEELTVTPISIMDKNDKFLGENLIKNSGALVFVDEASKDELLVSKENLGSATSLDYSSTKDRVGTPEASLEEAASDALQRRRSNSIHSFDIVSAMQEIHSDIVKVLHDGTSIKHSDQCEAPTSSMSSLDGKESFLQPLKCRLDEANSEDQEDFPADKMHTRLDSKPEHEKDDANQEICASALLRPAQNKLPYEEILGWSDDRSNTISSEHFFGSLTAEKQTVNASTLDNDVRVSLPQEMCIAKSSMYAEAKEILITREWSGTIGHCLDIVSTEVDPTICHSDIEGHQGTAAGLTSNSFTSCAEKNCEVPEENITCKMIENDMPFEEETGVTTESGNVMSLGVQVSDPITELGRLISDPSSALCKCIESLLFEAVEEKNDRTKNNSVPFDPEVSTMDVWPDRQNNPPYSFDQDHCKKEVNQTVSETNLAEGSSGRKDGVAKSAGEFILHDDNSDHMAVNLSPLSPSTNEVLVDQSEAVNVATGSENDLTSQTFSAERKSVGKSPEETDMPVNVDYSGSPVGFTGMFHVLEDQLPKDAELTVEALHCNDTHEDSSSSEGMYDIYVEIMKHPDEENFGELDVLRGLIPEATTIFDSLDIENVEAFLEKEDIRSVSRKENLTDRNIVQDKVNTEVYPLSSSHKTSHVKCGNQPADNKVHDDKMRSPEAINNYLADYLRFSTEKVADGPSAFTKDSSADQIERLSKSTNRRVDGCEMDLNIAEVNLFSSASHVKSDSGSGNQLESVYNEETEVIEGKDGVARSAGFVFCDDNSDHVTVNPGALSPSINEILVEKSEEVDVAAAGESVLSPKIFRYAEKKSVLKNPEETDMSMNVENTRIPTGLAGMFLEDQFPEDAEPTVEALHCNDAHEDVSFSGGMCEIYVEIIQHPDEEHFGELSVLKGLIPGVSTNFDSLDVENAETFPGDEDIQTVSRNENFNEETFVQDRVNTDVPPLSTHVKCGEQLPDYKVLDGKLRSPDAIREDNEVADDILESAFTNGYSADQVERMSKSTNRSDNSCEMDLNIAEVNLFSSASRVKFDTGSGNQPESVFNQEAEVIEEKELIDEAEYGLRSEDNLNRQQDVAESHSVDHTRAEWETFAEPLELNEPLCKAESMLDPEESVKALDSLRYLFNEVVHEESDISIDRSVVSPGRSSPDHEGGVLGYEVQPDVCTDSSTVNFERPSARNSSHEDAKQVEDEHCPSSISTQISGESSPDEPISEAVQNPEINGAFIYPEKASKEVQNPCTSVHNEGHLAFVRKDTESVESITPSDNADVKVDSAAIEKSDGIKENTESDETTSPRPSSKTAEPNRGDLSAMDTGAADSEGDQTASSLMREMKNNIGTNSRLETPKKLSWTQDMKENATAGVKKEATNVKSVIKRRALEKIQNY